MTGSRAACSVTALLLADLGVTKSHSRPYTSDDNLFSESCFKTLKYQPQFPKQFGSIEDAKNFCRAFEPPRVCRRPQLLRGSTDDRLQTAAVFAGSEVVPDHRTGG